MRMLVATTMLMAGASPVFAQTAEEHQSEPQSAASHGIEEVTVTARFREEKLSDVPDAITAFGGEQLEQMRIQSVENLINHIPNFTMKSSSFRAGVNLVQIRGVSSGGQGFPPVNYVVDDVKSGALQSMNQAVLLDVEQIEVLRGPQSATYGAGAIAGALNITTRKPTNTPEGRLVASYGTGNDVTLKGTVSGPIIADRVTGRLVAYFRDTDGLTDTENGDDLDFLTQKYVKGRAIVTLTDNATLDLRGTYTEIKTGGAKTQRLASPDLINTFDEDAVPIRRGLLGTDDLDVVDFSVKLDVDLPFARFTATAGYSDIDESVLGTASWTEPPAVGEAPVPALLGPIFGAGALPGQAIDRYQDVTDPVSSYSGDLRLTSSATGRLRWVVGTEFIQRDSGRDLELGSFVAPLPGSRSALIRQSNREDVKLFGVYSQVNYDLTSALELTLAGRYDTVDLSSRRRDYLTGVVIPQTDPAGNTVLELRESNDKFQPKAQLSYRWNPDLMTYVTYAEGFRSGFFASGGLTAPETTKNYEVGFKSSFNDRRVSLNGALFKIDYSNQQTSTFVATPPFRIVTNTPKTEIKGVELELTYLPIDKLDLNASVGYLDAEVTGENRQPDMAPKWTINLGGQFTQPVSSSMNLFARADWRYQGKYQLFNRPVVYNIHSADLVDLRLGVDAGKWGVTGYVQNMLDEQYATLAQQASNFYLRDYSDPRSYGIEVSYRF